ncbi:MAG: hypothetical protein WEE03_11905 [Chloroflexota bacterium]
MAALAAYGHRYRAVVEGIVPKFRAPTDVSDLTVVKRLRGSSTTDFGVPALGLPTDGAPVTPDELELLTRVLQACWDALDRAGRSAKGLELRKGPRGGGRDLGKISAHAVEADQAYIVKLGARPPKGAGGRPPRSTELREAMLEAMRARARGLPVADPSRAKTLWTPRYFARRVAWHVLDHAWEVEDRAILPAPGPSGLAGMERRGLIRRAEGDLLKVVPVRMPKGKRRPSDLVSEGRGS